MGDPNLPEGTSAFNKYGIKKVHECPECGWTWEAIMSREYGAWYYDNDEEDGICPCCGEEGEIIS